jgi:ATP-dependent DNA ligase
MLPRTLPAGFIAPCLPIKTDRLPSSREWLHEIKHDGYCQKRTDGECASIVARAMTSRIVFR